MLSFLGFDFTPAKSWTINYSTFLEIKVENILDGSLDSIPSPSPSVKFKLWAEKFTLGNKAKHCSVMSTNFLFVDNA